MIRLILTLLVLTGAASAQSVQQSGTVTPGHVPTWVTTGVQKDGGTPASPQITGGIGVANSNQRSICTQNSQTGAVSQLCLGSTPTGTFLTSSTLGGGPDIPFTIQVNGVNFPVPASLVGPWLFATNFGVKADAVIDANGALVSGTSDDAAMQSAVASCSLIGGMLVVPPGNILLNGTGGVSMNMNKCDIVGAGNPVVSTLSGGPIGTTFIMTSATTSPFVCGKNWGWSGINFYWPTNTTGIATIPPLMADTGGNVCGDAYINNVVIVNAVNAFVQSTTDSWENFIISNSILYSTKDMFALKKTGGSWVINNILAGPGPWFNICPPCKASGGTNANRNSSFVHAVNNGGGQGISVSATNINTFNWAHFALLDNLSSIGNSVWSVNLDGMRNIIDASAGGIWQSQNIFTGNNSGCGGLNWDSGSPVSEGNDPCFNMGANSGLVLSDYQAGASRGDMVTFSGGTVTLQGRGSGQIGQAADGGDYYVVHLTAPSPNANIIVQGYTMGGRNGDVHTHGIVSANAISRLKIQNSTFGQLNDVISVPWGGDTLISGNDSVNTAGTFSVTNMGSGAGSWFGNHWDKPPLAAVSSCGTGASITGTLKGTVTVGSPGPVTSCVITLPFTPFSAGGNGACSFNISGTANLNAVSAGTPPAWTITASVDSAGRVLNYNCGSE